MDGADPTQKDTLRPLIGAADRFAVAAAAAGARTETLLASDEPDRRAAAQLDEALMKTERAFLDAAGLPGRPWYRHLLFAPKPSYAAEVLPGVTEALGLRDRTQLVTQVSHLVGALGRAAALLDPSRAAGPGSDLDFLAAR
jgi:N-acetylated-alpha-linked acidic dipeptidase